MLLTNELDGDDMCVDKKIGKVSCTIKSNVEFAEDIFEMLIEWKDVATVKPGQFVNLYCESEAMLLPRPISICEVDRETGIMKLVYAAISSGTKSFAKLKAGEEIELLGPLGNGYQIVECNESILVGGGVGTPPLVELAKRIKGKKSIYLGFRTNPYLVEELKKYGDVYVATDDGSMGYKGTVVKLMDQTGAMGQQLYACGPKPMLKALQVWAQEHHIEAQFSLEERMGCGFGACVGCVCKIKADNEFGYVYKKVCKDGPVFDAKEVLL